MSNRFQSNYKNNITTSLENLNKIKDNVKSDSNYCNTRLKGELFVDDKITVDTNLELYRGIADSFVLNNTEDMYILNGLSADDIYIKTVKNNTKTIVSVPDTGGSFLVEQNDATELFKVDTTPNLYLSGTKIFDSGNFEGDLSDGTTSFSMTEATIRWVKNHTLVFIVVHMNWNNKNGATGDIKFTLPKVCRNWATPGTIGNYNNVNLATGNLLGVEIMKDLSEAHFWQHAIDNPSGLARINANDLGSSGYIVFSAIYETDF